MRNRILLAGGAVAGLALLTSCGSTSNPPGSSSSHGMDLPATSTGMSTARSSDDMGGMPMTSGTGLNATVNGYTLTLHSSPMAGMTMPVTFTITKNGRPVTAFDPEQTKLMHLYLIRFDLSGFQHLHPTMQPDGTWTAIPSRLAAGQYRAYGQFVPHADAGQGALVLSRLLTVAGAAASSAAIPAPASSTTVDGYTIAMTGAPRAGAETPIQLNVSRNGQPVTDLQPYLDTYAHVIAIHAGDLAFAHLHPAGPATGERGGPTLTINAELPEPGRYRVFIQFRISETLHTAALTIAAG